MDPVALWESVLTVVVCGDLLLDLGWNKPCTQKGVVCWVCPRQDLVEHLGRPPDPIARRRPGCPKSRD